ncbi:MAG: hypothetical protein CM15mP84_08400 [Cellvibrionales bacterium]|nr:MAG: hypothetical protein CM15mP84_08400 [Cellvibrionales bacterium]
MIKAGEAAFRRYLKSGPKRRPWLYCAVGVITVATVGWSRASRWKRVLFVMFT